MIKRLEIQQYKGFYNKQVFDIAIPDKKNRGSGLTIIVGPNNTGKTTVIESLLLSQNAGNKKFNITDRHEKKQPKVGIFLQNGASTTITNINSGSLLAKSVTGDFNHSMQLIPSRRYWQYKFTGESALSNLSSNSLSTNSIRGNGGELQLGPILKTILENKEQKSAFNAYLTQLIPHFEDWTIDTNESDQDFVNYKVGNQYHQAGNLGDGIISLFRIVSHIINDEAGMSYSTSFIIDEPELSLHPNAQKRLASLLSKISTTRQIIICTHSPYFVSWEDFARGCNVIRLNKTKGKISAHILNHQKEYSSYLAKNISEYQKPQALDVVSKEILFTDKILFAEGQDDVGLIRQWMAGEGWEGDFDVYGYGVGGENNMKLFLEMSKDLGLNKVCALYDSGTSSFREDSKSYPMYLLQELPTRDIRDKTKKSDGKTRTGIFKSNGELKSKYKVPFKRLMTNFKDDFRKFPTIGNRKAPLQ